MTNINLFMWDTNPLIPAEIAIAPKHPLAKNLELPIPDPRTATPAQIQEIQLRDRIPGVVKRIVPLDASMSWEYWWCVPGRLLLAEDVELLQQDLTRMETILSKLLWLFGGCCFTKGTCCEGEQPAIYDWQEVVTFAHQQGFESYLLDIDFFQTAIKLGNNRPVESAGKVNPPSHIAVEPAHWHIEFFQLQPTAGGFEIQEPKPLCSCQIWTGRPFIKHVETGTAVTRYDLWVSSPHNVTNPPWLQ